MYITVEEALALPAMSEAQLLAGKAGLSKKITSVNIMEVPEISKFVKPGELIITTLWPIKDNIKLQEELIRDLVDKGVTAIAICPLSEETGVPSVMIQDAEVLSFPLIKLPCNTSFNDILNPVLNQILERKYIETEYRFRAKIIQDIILGRIVSKSRLMMLWNYYGWVMAPHFIPAFIQPEKVEYQGPDSNNVSLQNLSQKSREFGFFETIVADLDDGILLLFPCDELSKKVKNKVWSILDKLCNELGKVNIGIGNDISDIMKLSDGVFQARLAAMICQKTFPGQKIIDFDSLGVYRVLIDLPDQEISSRMKHEFVEEKLGLLIEYDKTKGTDFVRTLDNFFKENQNLRQASRKLYIHYNTMRNRLNQIELLTQSDLNDAETCFEFQVAIKLAELL